MSSNQRKREYERRRYEKWQDKQAERLATRRRRRRQSLVAGGAALAVVVMVAGVLLATRGEDGTNIAADPTMPATASAGPTTSTSAGPNPCPDPTAAPVASPQQWTSAPPASTAEGKAFTLTLRTSCGPIVISLDGTTAPRGVASTVFLAQKKFYDGTPCHRLTTEGIFVLQCGDPTGTGTGGPGYSYGPVENAPEGDLYPAGTVAMARQGGDGESMGSQFFLVYQDSTIPSDAGGGYTVLGTVTSGLDVVQKVAEGGVAADGTAPNRPVAIESATVEAG